MVVGLPLSLSGADTAQTAEARAFAERLRGLARRARRALRRALHDPLAQQRSRRRRRGLARRRGAARGVAAPAAPSNASRSGPIGRSMEQPFPPPVPAWTSRPHHASRRLRPTAPATRRPPRPRPRRESSSDDPLDALLKQIIGGWFILTDGQGAVSKWSEPAELLFGKEAPDALGHSFFDDLLSGPLSDDAEQWRRFLAAGDPPHAPRARRGHRQARPDGRRSRSRPSSSPSSSTRASTSRSSSRTSRSSSR